MRCHHVNFIYSHITHYVRTSSMPHRLNYNMAIRHNRILCCDTSLLQINCFHTSLAYCFLLHIVFFSFFYIFNVCWCRLVCVSPLFLLIVDIFGDFADFTPPLTSELSTLLWHITPFSVHYYCMSQKYYYESDTS